MPVPSSINDLSASPGSNFPSGSESPATFDDYVRAHAAFIALLRDEKTDLADAVLLTTNQTIAGVKTFSSTIAGSISGNAATATEATHADTATNATNAGNATGPAASTAVAGIQKNASDGETQAGTSITHSVTPSSLRAAVLGSTLQTLTDVTGSRSLGVNYTNNTGRPIFVSVRGTTTSGSSTGNGVRLFVGVESIQGTASAGTGSGWSSQVSSIIPNGVSYAATFSNGTLAEWKEIR